MFYARNSRKTAAAAPPSARLARAAALISVLAGGAIGAQQAQAQVTVRTAQGVAKAKPGEILVKFRQRPSLSLNALRSSTSAIRAQAKLVNAKIGAKEVETFDFIGWQLVKLPAGMTVEEGIAKYLKQPGVIAAEPNYLRVVDATPNDPKFSEQYSMLKIQAQKAWDRNKGNGKVVVAVIDNGIDYNHPDLKANMWRNPGEVGNGKETNGIDDDKNGYVDDVYGIDGADGDSDPIYHVDIDPQTGAKSGEHGTHVAGIIGAVGNNGIGVTGVNWNVKIMALRGLSNQAAYADGTLRCLRYATAMKLRGINIRVTNNSYGGYGAGSQADLDAFNAAGAAGILNVASAGNNGQDNDKNFHFVSDYAADSILSVGSSDEGDYRSSFSNYGRTAIDLAAPGSSIWSTVPPEFSPTGFEQLDGTSMASPCVAGAAALLAAINPAATVAQLKSTLMNTVDPISDWEGKTVTGGRLNLARAAAAIQPTALPMVTAISPSGPISVLRPAIKVNFNVAMNPTTVQSAFEITPKVAGTFVWANNTQVTFTPSVNLTAGAMYLVKIKGTAASATGVTIDSDLNKVSNGSPIDDFSRTFRIEGAPFNDMFAKAYLLSGENGTIAGHNRGATRETGEPQHNTTGPGDKSVWYKWVAPVRGNVTLNTNGSGFYNVLGVYTGTAVGALSRVGGAYWPDNNAVSATFRAEKGKTYYIAVDGFYFPKSDNYPAFTDQGNFFLSWSTYASPVNDNYSGALALTGNTGSTTGDTRGCYWETGEEYHTGRDSSIWYKWIAPGTGAVTFDTEGSAFDTTLNAYTGTTVSTAVRVAQDNDGGTGSLSNMPFTVLKGVTYYITVGGNGYAFSDPRGLFKLNWKYVAGPSNDSFATPIVLSPVNGGTVLGTTIGATLQTGEQDPTWGNGVASIWYKWTPTADGAVLFSTAKSAFDTDLSVWTGTTPAGLTQIDHNNDDAGVANAVTSKVKFTAKANTTYYIRIDAGHWAATEASEGYPQTHGATSLNWAFTAAPSNDKFAKATLLSLASGTATGTTVGATLDLGEEDPTWGNGGSSIWYKYIPAASGALTISTAGSKAVSGAEYDTMLNVYTGTAVDALEDVTYNNDDETSDPLKFSRVRFDVTKGITYLIRIDTGGWATGDSAQMYNATHGTVALKWDFVAGPANDNFASATNLSPITSGKVTGSTVGATMQDGEEDPSWGSGPQSIWYKLTPTANGLATITTAGSKALNGLTYDTYLGVYSGSLGNLNWVAANGDDGNLVTSKVAFDAEAGVTYYIRVSNGGWSTSDSYKAYQASHGSVSLGWTFKAGASTGWFATKAGAARSNLIASATEVHEGDTALRLAFTGALDAASATDSANYAVTVDGQPVDVQSASIVNNGLGVALTLPEDVFQTGTSIHVSWNIQDAAGKDLQGGANATVR